VLGASSGVSWSFFQQTSVCGRFGLVKKAGHRSGNRAWKIVEGANMWAAGKKEVPRLPTSWALPSVLPMWWEGGREWTRLTCVARHVNLTPPPPPRFLDRGRVPPLLVRKAADYMPGAKTKVVLKQTPSNQMLYCACNCNDHGPTSFPFFFWPL